MKAKQAGVKPKEARGVQGVQEQLNKVLLEPLEKSNGGRQAEEQHLLSGELVERAETIEK